MWDRANDNMRALIGYVFTFWIGRLWLLSVSANTAPNPHVGAPFEIAMGSLEERLKKSTTETTKADNVHFRERGTISGDLGMIHIGIQSNLKEYQDKMREVCKMPMQLRKRIKDMILDDANGNKTLQKSHKNESLSQPPVRNGERIKKHNSKHYDRVLTNLDEECEMLQHEINDIFLIWYSSFNRPGTSVDKNYDNPVGEQIQNSDYDLNNRRLSENNARDPRVNTLNTLTGPPEAYDTETNKRGTNTDSSYGNDGESTSSNEKEDWRYWLDYKLSGLVWPPTYRQMPQYKDGSVKIELWNYILRKISRWQSRRNATSESDDEDDQSIRWRGPKPKKSKRSVKPRRRRFIFTLLAMAAAAISSLVFTEYEINRSVHNICYNSEISNIGFFSLEWRKQQMQILTAQLK